jgi:serine/threonine-protein kinase
MTLQPGTGVGSYEIIAPLGAGGMGEVYRAKDTKLGRDVALKILPASFTNDPDRVARFRREAQVLASLNHPHIAQIYGLEEANGTQFLVLELVDGESLDKRIARGRIPVDEALGIAKQIAEALEAAHEKGIIHRDLKPANIALTKDGSVKVLDFGLAKAVETMGAPVDAMNSPTITTPAMMTGVGVILGTAAYMSPEQAKGRAADRQSDIWAFGCVLFEMLTGTRAFVGDDVGDTLASVLAREPQLDVIPATVPRPIRTLLKGCLAKDRKQRIGDVSTVVFVLRESASLAGADGSRAADAPLRSRRPATIVWVAAGMVISAILAAGAVWVAMRPTPRVTRTTIATDVATTLTINGLDRDIAITPDGSRIVYVGGNGSQLLIRSLDALEPIVIATGTSLRSPFVSPDGQWVGFVESPITLKKVAITGGPALTITELGSGPRGLVWAADDSIIFSTINAGLGLQRVPAKGGTPTVLSKPALERGEAGYQWPELLPDGQHVLFTVTARAGADAASIAVLDLHTGAQHVVFRGGSHAQYVASGHLVYGAAGTLRAVPFDVKALTVHGTPVPVVPRIVSASSGAFDFSVASDGTLVYVDAPGASDLGGRRLVWVDRTGREEATGAPVRNYGTLSLSPDGTRVAVGIVDQDNDIWIWDFKRATLMRLTTEPGLDANPIWTPDGRRIIFSSERDGTRNLWWQAADNSDLAERLTKSPNIQNSTGITPDGKTVIFYEIAPGTTADVMRLSLTGDRTAAPLVQTKFAERNGVVSPNGHWLAYESYSASREEVYVRPYPNTTAGLSQISTAGGTRPVWARNGKELFYLSLDNAMMRVSVEESATTWNHTTPVKLFDAVLRGNSAARGYDVSPDGRRFLLIRAVGAEQAGGSPSIVVVQHFDEELKAKVAVK